MQADVVVIGGGAAGFFAAIQAARTATQARVLLLERSDKLLAKVRISGGGRCNVTHDCHSLDTLITHYPRGGRWLKKALGRWSVQHTLDWFAAEGVHCHTEADGRMFPTSNDSASIVDALMAAAARAGVQVRRGMQALAMQPHDAGWTVDLADEKSVQARCVVVATGGSPKLAGLQWLAALGHTIVPPVPSLFSLNLADASLKNLAGISVADATVSLQNHKLRQRGALLITHWGISGPAVLRLSAWAAHELAAVDYHTGIHINWLPHLHTEACRAALQQWRQQHATRQLANRNPAGLPVRLWQYLLHRAGVAAEQTWATLTKGQLHSMAQMLTEDSYAVQGKTTYKEEFVTAGGVALAGVEAATMASKLHPGLYFCGEVLDIDGVTGGFNFQAAWATGHLAGTQAALRV